MCVEDQVCLALTCDPEAHGAQRSALILSWNDEQTERGSVLVRLDGGQLQGEVSGECSISWERGAVNAQLLHVFAPFPHWSEHHFLASPPLDGKVLKA